MTIEWSIQYFWQSNKRGDVLSPSPYPGRYLNPLPRLLVFWIRVFKATHFLNFSFLDYSTSSPPSVVNYSNPFKKFAIPLLFYIPPIICLIVRTCEQLSIYRYIVGRLVFETSVTKWGGVPITLKGSKKLNIIRIVVFNEFFLHSLSTIKSAPKRYFKSFPIVTFLTPSPNTSKNLGPPTLIWYPQPVYGEVRPNIFWHMFYWAFIFKLW